MSKRNKFEQVDVIASLDAILQQNTLMYQSDFEIDKAIIARAAASPNKEDKTLLWLCRPLGTYCLREREVFLQDTPAHKTWLFYKEQTPHARILAYAIELTDQDDEEIKGNLYELDYAKHYERVKDKALRVEILQLIYEDGEQRIPADLPFSEEDSPLFGKLERIKSLPKDSDMLQSLLKEEKRNRKQLTQGDFQAHITALHHGLIKAEAQRIANELARYRKPNSPDQAHFMAGITPAFERMASTEDMDRLFSLLPYQSLVFSHVESQNGLYALIDQNEKRTKRIIK